ncbi:MAG: isoamylase early set domain-containing protein [Anaerolineales bacterium]
MLTKRKLGRGKVRVTFSMPPLDDVTQMSLVGEFNDWDIDATPLKLGADGQWSTSLSLEEGRDYQFRYLANGLEWHNDWAADRYQLNEHGTDNSVVSLKDMLPAPKKNGRAKKVL